MILYIGRACNRNVSQPPVILSNITHTQQSDLTVDLCIIVSKYVYFQRYKPIVCRSVRAGKGLRSAHLNWAKWPKPTQTGCRRIVIHATCSFNHGCFYIYMYMPIFVFVVYIHVQYLAYTQSYLSI